MRETVLNELKSCSDFRNMYASGGLLERIPDPKSYYDTRSIVCIVGVRVFIPTTYRVIALNKTTCWVMKRVSRGKSITTLKLVA